MQSFHTTNKHVSLGVFQSGLVLFLLLGAFGSLLAQSATETAGTVVSNGSGNAWSPLTASDVSNSDGSRISATAPTSGDPTQFLDLTGFNFNLPAGATINGIVVEIERQKSAGNRDIRDNTIQLLKAGNPVGQNKASGTNWPTSDATASYGGNTDLWMTTWTEAEIEASGFGLRIAIEDFGGGGPARDGQIDQVQITVHYTIAAPAPVANDDNAANLTPGSAHTIDILANDELGDGTTPAPPGSVSVDIDQTMAGTQTTLNVPNEGDWSYNTSNGQLTFTPEAGFGGDPTVLTYTLIEGSENDNANVTLDYDVFDLELTKTLQSQSANQDFNADGTTTYSPGEEVTFRFTITNNGDIDATGIILTDYFDDSQLTLSTTSWTQTGTSPNVIATLSAPVDVTAGNSVDVDIFFLINADFTGTLITNNGEISAIDNTETDIDSSPDATNDEDCPTGANDEDDHDCADVTVTQRFDLALRKEFIGFTDNDGDALITDGDVVQFGITILNQGTVDATEVVVKEYIPTEFDAASAALTSANYMSVLGNTINVDATDLTTAATSFTLSNGLPVGDEVQVLIDFTVGNNSDDQLIVTNAAEISAASNASGVQSNDADGTFDAMDGNGLGETTNLEDDQVNGDGNAGEDEDDHDIEVIAINPLFDLALTNEVLSYTDGGTSGTIDNGDQITLRMTVYNQGTTDASDIQIVHYFDNTVLSLNDANWGALAAGQVTLNTVIPTLTAGSNTTIDITFDVIGSAASILTFAEIFSFDNVGGGNNDVDSQVATLDSGGADETNDAGGRAGSANDNFINGDGTGTAGDGVAASDEDDHDPAHYAFACDLNIDNISVNRSFDASTGETSFSLDIAFTWDNSGTDIIDVMIDGSTVTTFNTPTLAGSANVTNVGSFTTPAFDVPVRLSFANNPACQSQREIHLIADTDPCTSGPGGVVFQDFDLDGVRDTPNEAGLPNIRVYVYDDNDAEVYSTYTNTLGQWSTSGLGAGPYRIEFDPSLNDRYASAFATSGTTVQFWSSGDCNIDAGFLAPDDYCDENADRTMITPCYVSGDPLLGDVAQENWVVQFPYPPTNTQGDNVYLAQGNPTGTTWGSAIRNVDPNNFTLYLSAFMRRHSGFGQGGPGAIYALDLTDLSNPPSTVTTTTFVDLDGSPFNFDFGTDPRGTDVNNPPLPSDPIVPNYDPLAFDLVGKMAMGDLDFDEEQNVLWTINLHTREVYEIQLGANGAAPTMASDITVHSLPDPGCSNGVFRAWAVEFFDGKLYIGGVCTGENGGTRDDLVAYIYSHDPNGPVGNWSEVFSFPLDYDRGFLSKQGSKVFEGEWNPWLSDWNDIGAANTPYAHLPTPDNGPFGQTAAPQPVFSDIEFDADGSIVVGIADRFGWQIGNNNYSTNIGDTDVYEGVAGGDILRISRVDGVLTLENNANANTVAGNQTTTGQNSNPAQGPGGGEFYWQDMYRLSGNKNSGTHQEITGGSLMLVPCEAEIATVVFDPAREYRAGGAIGLSNIDGSRTWSYQIFGRDAGGRGATFGKAISFGDVQLFYDASPPLQIGNRVFVDTDKDGAQDPSEAGVANVQVALFDAAGTLLATTTTDANGNYTFTGDGTAGENWENTGDAIMSNTQYYVVFGTDGDTGGGGADQFDTGTNSFTANGVNYHLTTANAGNGAIPENNDSDAEFETDNTFSWLGYPAISVNTGATGFSNHTFDMGLQQSFDWGDLPDDGSMNPGPYPTDMMDDGGEGVGPSHRIINGLVMGATVDDEDDGNPSANADGDDNTDMPNDEDGIDTFPTFEAGQTVTVNVTATNSGTISMDDATLYAFFDWNGDGDFGDPDEIVSITVPDGSVNTTFPLMVMVPMGATVGQDLGVRLRLTTDDLDDATRLMTFDQWEGPAADGEVEDYLIQVQGPAIVALGNLVFVDANNNGQFDPGIDQGIDGVEVQLLDENDMPVDNPNMPGTDYIVTTSGGGFYEFDNLLPGNYKVFIPASNFGSNQPLDGLVSSSPEGIDNDQDDNADENGQNTLFNGGVISTVIELTVGGEPENEAGQGAYSGTIDDNSANMTVDFGFVGPVSVGNFVWIDLDNDGLQDGSEPGLDGVDVTIYDAATDMPVTLDLDGNPYMATQTTTGGGMYLFTDLPPGSYYVNFDLTDIPDIYGVTTQNVDGNVSDDEDSDASLATGQTIATPALTSGQADLSLDMGVFCVLDAEAGNPATICRTKELLLSSISPSVTPASLEATAVWNTSGDGTFFSATSVDLGNTDVPFNNAFSYQPGTQDALNGGVTLTLTVGPAGQCDAVSDQVIIIVQKVDCGSFPWDGGSTGAAPLTPQQRLDAGETPCELLDDGVPIDDLYGLTYQGGLIFYVDNSSGCSGLVAAPTDSDLSGDFFHPWGCFGTAISGADGTAVGTGAQNTADIIAGCPTAGIAARVADNYDDGTYSDWFLPSRDELNLMWENLHRFGCSLDNSPCPTALGGFSDENYWSSSEISSVGAWGQDFSEGPQGAVSKSNFFRVRAVRAF